MKTKNNYILIACGLLISATFIISYLNYRSYKDRETLLLSEKKLVLKDLKIAQNTLEIAISENISLKTELILERQKVSNLIEEIQSKSLDFTSLYKYKKETKHLENVMSEISKEKIDLRKKNEFLKHQRDSTVLVLNETKNYFEKLNQITTNLKTKIKKGSKISILNLKTVTLKKYKHGIAKTTDKAKRTKIVNVSFVVLGNKMIKEQNKEFYVQILDDNNNIIGNKKTKKFGNKTIEYSYASPVRFTNESLEVSADIEVADVEKGNYFVNVLDKNEIISKTTFALR